MQENVCSGMEITMADSASTLAIMLIEENIRKGKVIRIPSIGVILTSANLKDKTGAVSPTREKVVEALEDCVRSQERQLLTASNEEKERIIKTIFRLRLEINDPSDYIW